MECSSDIIILSDHGVCRVSKCKCCSRFQLTFKNILINLSYTQLQNLNNTISSLNIHWPYKSLDGDKAVLLRSQEGSSVYFGFSLYEWCSLKQLLEEAVEMNSFYENININLN